MAYRTLTEHEYRYRITGESFTSWIGCTTLNTIDNGDGTCTINDPELNNNIAIGDLQVRVKAIGVNPPSNVLTNSIAFVREVISNGLFGKSNGLVESYNVWTGINGGIWGNSGLALNYVLRENEDGAMYMRIPNDYDGSATGILCLRSIFDTVLFSAYETSEAAVWVNGYNLMRLGTAGGDNIDPSYEVLIGDYIGLFRESGIIKIKTSTDGLDWTLRHTFVGTFNNELYYLLNINQSGIGTVVYEPSIFNPDDYTPMNVLYISEGNSIAYGIGTTDALTKNFGYINSIILKEEDDRLLLSKNATSGANNVSIAERMPYSESLITEDYDIIAVSILEGANSLHTQNPTVAFNGMMDNVNAYLDLDPRVKVLIIPCLSCNSSYISESDRLEYNGYLYGLNETSRLKILNITGSAIFDDEFSWQDSDYYALDGVHLTDLGEEQLASIALAKTRLITGF